MERPLQSPSRPRFLETGKRVTVMESDEVGHMVALISAEDADGDKIWYSIIGEINSLFTPARYRAHQLIPLFFYLLKTYENKIVTNA